MSFRSQACNSLRLKHRVPRAPFVLSLLLAFATVSYAQETEVESAPLPGGQYRGRYIGFQPKHGEVHPPVPPHQRQGQVQPAGHQVMDGGTIILDQTPLLSDAQIADASCIPGCIRPNVYGRIELLSWWTDAVDTPALATTSLDGTDQEDAGVLGQLATSTLFGGDLLDDSRSGGRYTLGFWLNPHHNRALELSYLSLGDESESFGASQADFSILARPFFDVTAAAEDARLIVFPNLVEGSLDIRATTDFDTGEVLLRRVTQSCGQLDYYIGYRYAGLNETLSITESTLSLADPTTGATFNLTDQFESESDFHGVQIGARLFTQSTPEWSFELLGKLALGNTSTRTSISGLTAITDATGNTATQGAGLLAQSTNIGVFEDDHFSTLTELGATLRRHFGCNVALSVGYSFMVWTDVARVGNAIDTNINVTQIPPGSLTGEAAPVFDGDTSSFWAQGLRFGIEYGY